MSPLNLPILFDFTNPSLLVVSFSCLKFFALYELTCPAFSHKNNLAHNRSFKRTTLINYDYHRKTGIMENTPFNQKVDFRFSLVGVQWISKL